MFGLGPGELVILAVIVVLVAGPAAIPKLLRGLKSFQEARSKFTPRGVMDQLMNADRPKPSKKRKAKPKAPKAETDA